MGLFVGRDQRIFSLCLPSSAHLSAAHLSASSFTGSSRYAFVLMKKVRRPCSILSRRSCTISLMMSASGFPYIEGDLPSPIHFWEEERKHAESDRIFIGFLSCFLLASCSARHAAHNSALLEEFPAQLAASSSTFIKFKAASSHNPLVIRSVCGIYCPWEVIDA